MEVIYDVFIEDDEERFNNSPQKIEIIFSKLMKKEKELLEKYSFKYEYVIVLLKLMDKIKEYF